MNAVAEEEEEFELELTCKELGGFKDCDFKALAKNVQELIMKMEEHYWVAHHEKLSVHLRERIRHIIRRRFGV